MTGAALFTDDAILDRLIEREGRAFVQHPADRGGCSRFGITREVLREWRHSAFDVTCQDVRQVTEAEARQLYRHLFLALFHDVQDGRVKELLMDCAVHHGRGRAVRWLQEALDVEVDGIIGPETRGALAHADLVHLGRRLVRRRLGFLGELVTTDYRTRCALIEARLVGTPGEADVRTVLAGGQALNCAGWITRAAAFV